MERAIRTVTVERGHDPRAYALVAFGGAAPLHACEIADGLGLATVLVPHAPGVLSARGAAEAPVVREYVRTVRLREPEAAALERIVAALGRAARGDMRREHVSLASLEAHLAVRYEGQSFELDVPLTRGYRRAFHALHERLYGHADRKRAVEVVNIAVRASGKSPLSAAAMPRGRMHSGATASSERGRLRTAQRWSAARIYRRDDLPAGAWFAGPAVIQELSATTYLPPGWTARVDRRLHLVLRRAR
jgi:N-methylhydantoinase A